MRVQIDALATMLRTLPLLTPAQAKAAIGGGLSKPEKMPCDSYGLPAKACGVGSKLARVVGSICSGCYALKGRYVMPNVAEAQGKRLVALTSDSEGWTRGMFAILKRKRNEHFRWHDSGDVQGIEHMQSIVALALALPAMTFWLPTKEYGVVAALYRAYGSRAAFNAAVPNLTIRVSLTMRDQSPVAFATAYGTTSGVHATTQAQGTACVAPSQDGECRDCRACWSRDVSHVSYRMH